MLLMLLLINMMYGAWTQCVDVVCDGCAVVVLPVPVFP